ncbi:MAG: diacylglycerol kinase [Planctomycetota bacterium]
MGIESWLFVVNPLSGGRLGERLLRHLRHLVPADRVGDLLSCDLTALVRRCDQEACPLVVMGGDGSVSSVLNVVAEAGMRVPVGVLPLGTGNDLAAHLGVPNWRIPQLGQRLRDLEGFHTVSLDRWQLRGPSLRSWWYNYCSFGADARIAHQFHVLRMRHPEWFRGRGMNKFWYGMLGLLDPPRRLQRTLGSHLAGRLSDSSRSLVLANITSYAGGSRLCDRIDARDGLLDVLALPGGISLALRLQGLRRTTVLARVPRLDIHVRAGTHLQVDGEARPCRAGVYRILYGGQVPVLASRPAVSTVRTAAPMESGRGPEAASA